MAQLTTSCQESKSSTGTDGITHWLRCDDSGDCHEGADCVCGTCAPICESDSDCTKLHRSARCEGSSDISTRYSCDESTSSPVCTISCSSAADCGDASEWSCTGDPNGYCVRLGGAADDPPDAGELARGGSGGEGGDSAAVPSQPSGGSAGIGGSGVEHTGGGGSDVSQSGSGGAPAAGGTTGSSGGASAAGGSGGSGASTGGGGSTGAASTGGNANSGGATTGGSVDGGGANAGGNAGSGGTGTGGSAGSGGSTHTGGSSGAGGDGGAAGSGGYDPCAGKACGDSCSTCDPNDPDCVAAPVITVCDIRGECVAEATDLCLGEIWSETDAARYSLDGGGTVTLHNDVDFAVYLPGCEHYYYEMLVGGEWTLVGSEGVMCTWEGYARPVLPGTSVESNIGSFDDTGPGTWRIRHTLGYGCADDQVMSAEYCTSIVDVYTPSFTVGIDPSCGDPTLIAAYAECSAASDADTCAELGGTWGPFGLSEVDICQCSTGQGSCACTQDSDCLTMCMAPTGDGGISDCSAVTVGTCAAGPTAGCWCRLEGSGAVTSICID